MNKQWAALSTIPLAFIITGCEPEPEPTDKVNTSGIAPYIEVHANEEATMVSVDLRFGADRYGNRLYLADTDALYASVDDTKKKLTPSDFVSDDGPFGETTENIYVREFDQNAGGSQFTVSLERDEEDDAPDSNVQLPSKFEFTSNVDEQTFASADTILIQWKTGGNVIGDDHYSDWTVECKTKKNEHVAVHHANPDMIITDNKKIDVTGNDLLNIFVNAESFAELGHCDFKVKLIRENMGQLDDAFEDGYILATQSELIRFRVNAQ
jgi:hypothetical protein